MTAAIDLSNVYSEFLDWVDRHVPPSSPTDTLPVVLTVVRTDEGTNVTDVEDDGELGDLNRLEDELSLLTVDSRSSDGKSQRYLLPAYLAEMVLEEYDDNQAVAACTIDPDLTTVFSSPAEAEATLGLWKPGSDGPLSSLAAARAAGQRLAP